MALGGGFIVHAKLDDPAGGLAQQVCLYGHIPHLARTYMTHC